jgi:hypothetical protein
MTTIEERIDAAQTLSEYEALCSEVEGMDTKLEENRIFLASISLLFNSKRLLQDAPDDANRIAIRNLARRRALLAMSSVRQWVIECAQSEKDVRFVRSHLITITYDYDHEYMSKPEPYLWGVLLSMCLQKLIGMGSITGCTMIIKILADLNMEVPGLTEDDKLQIRDMEFAKVNAEFLNRIVVYLHENNINFTKMPICIITNESYEGYVMALRNSDKRAPGTRPAGQKKGSDEVFIGHVEDSQDSGTSVKRCVYYTTVGEVFYVYKNNQRLPVIPDILATALMEQVKHADAIEMKKRVADLQLNTQEQ